MSSPEKQTVKLDCQSLDDLMLIEDNTHRKCTMAWNWGKILMITCFYFYEKPTGDFIQLLIKRKIFQKIWFTQTFKLSKTIALKTIMKTSDFLGSLISFWGTYSTWNCNWLSKRLRCCVRLLLNVFILRANEFCGVSNKNRTLKKFWIFDSFKWFRDKVPPRSLWSFPSKSVPPHSLINRQELPDRLTHKTFD